MPKILITSGGTIEKIDDVRGIANYSTGLLGAEIATAFARRGCEIFYIRGKGAVSPKITVVDEIVVSDVASLEVAVSEVLGRQKIDVIVHAMAVSDYRVKRAARLSNLDENVNFNGKISSEIDDLVLIMEKTPKIIKMFKKIASHAVLVGFKLVSGMDEQGIISTGFDLLTKNGCDFVLANDAAFTNFDNHAGWLIDRNKSYKKFINKTNIAEGIAAATLGELG